MEVGKPNKVMKSWGYELIVHNSPEYCGKLLVFPEKNKSFSMHYHMKKIETWYVNSGTFIFTWIDVNAAMTHYKLIQAGDVVEIPQGQPHQLESVEDDSVIFEVSTEHFDNDSYRIWR